MSEEFTRIANSLERIATALEHLHIEKIDHAHIDDIGEIHGDVVTHPKQFLLWHRVSNLLSDKMVL